MLLILAIAQAEAEREQAQDLIGLLWVPTQPGQLNMTLSEKLKESWGVAQQKNTHLTEGTSGFNSSD